MFSQLVCTCVVVISYHGLLAKVITPNEMQKQMGLGINLGNRLDIWEQKKPKTVEEQYFQDFKDAGFTNVRIPVCWGHRWVAEDAPYKIDEDFISLVEKYVDYTIDRGMVAILNTHHEKWMDTANTTLFEANLPRLEAIWKQIAERFANRSQSLLVFEVFNEPHRMKYDKLNEMNAAIVPIIRKSNPTRIVLISGLQYGNPKWIVKKGSRELVIPKDAYLMLEIHYYDPWTYAGADPTQTSWGSSADRTALTEWMDEIDAWSKNNSLPIYYGEFGVTDAQSSATGANDWYKAHYCEITARGWGASVWNDGNHHLIYNYTSLQFVGSILADLGKTSSKVSCRETTRQLIV